VQSSALALQNFKTGPNSILSFKAELADITTENGVILLEPIGQEAGIISLAFSVIIITDTVTNLELISFSETDITPGTNISIQANSSNFNFDDLGGSPHAIDFLQWVTGDGSGNNESSVNYGV
jgi:hypothetical protein